jgi:hypothetical protein
MMDNSANPVAMDWYYAGERVDVSSVDTASTDGRETSSGTVSLDQRLLNATLESSGYANILLRQNVDVIRFPGGLFRLLWDPVSALNVNSNYSKSYDNGHAVGFSNK